MTLALGGLVALGAMLAPLACEESTDGPSAGAAGSAGSSTGGKQSDGSGGAQLSGGGQGGVGTGGASDLCGSALFCEKFDGYAGVTSIANEQEFGPWSANLQTGATMGLDGAHKTSGAHALHVHLDPSVTTGGRLYANGEQPLFADAPTRLYGRMMMYIQPNGSSVHWTFFGLEGPVEPSSPAAGRYASYLLSSLGVNNANTYSFVYGLSPSGDDGYHDCSALSFLEMPSAWACVSFEIDAVARTLRMYKDGVATPILAVDDHGPNCVPPTDATSPWYGPAVTQLFVGAWSFHPMNGPLDVWFDDLIVDTEPVSCPAK